MAKGIVKSQNKFEVKMKGTAKSNNPKHIVKKKVKQGASAVAIQKKGFLPKTKQQKGGPNYDKQQNYKGLDVSPQERQITKKKVLDRIGEKARQY